MADAAAGLEGRFDAAVVGGGIVGLASARALALAGRRVAVLEAEPTLAAHQTGHNSGVIHSGLYYAPGSLRARLCVAGREAMFRFCAAHAIPHERCGKLVIATRPEQLPRLDALEQRGRANGLQGLVRLDPDAFRAREPHAGGIAALLVPETGITDFAAVSEALGGAIRDAGGAVVTGARVTGVAREAGVQRVESTAGTVRCGTLVNCAGLQSDRIARMCGIDPEITIVPFRGEYWELTPGRRHLVRHLLYPVPDPRYPFLGVHFTRRVDGSVEAGPNAVLALAREGYRRTSASWRDVIELARWPGFWRMGATHWRTGLAESVRAASVARMAAALRPLLPEIRGDDLRYRGAGVRAQALDRSGRLLDDFVVVEREGQVHVLNAPSPAATAALAIGETIAARVAGGGERVALS